MQKLNPYGDLPTHALSGYGVDISGQRSDDLDLAMLAYVKELNTPGLHALDIGCGKGGHTIKLALTGCHVTAVDTQDFSTDLTEASRQHHIPEGKIEFIKADIRDTAAYLDGQYNFVYSQRVLHYISYNEAALVLKTIKEHLVGDGARIYISVSGLNSELGDGYMDKEKPVDQRFGLLSAAMRDKHKIDLPVCLYSLQEFEVLLVDCGYTIDKLYQSEFGNVKAVVMV